MDSIRFSCPKCGQHFEAPEDMFEQVIDCPTCNNRFQSTPPKTKLSPQPWMYAVSIATPFAFLLLFLFVEPLIKEIRENHIEKNGWQKALGENSKAGYQEFLVEWPDGSHHVEALSRYDELEWADVTSSNSVEGYKHYLRVHKDGRHRDQAKAKLDSASWAMPLSVHTIQAYEEYLKENSAGKHIADAKDAIRSIYWDEAVKTNTIQAYKTYLANYNQGKNSDKAIAKIKELERMIDIQHWREALARGTLEGYKGYLELLHNGRFTHVAREKVKTFDIKEQKARLNFGSKTIEIARPFFSENLWRLLTGDEPPQDYLSEELMTEYESKKSGKPQFRKHYIKSIDLIHHLGSSKNGEDRIKIHFKKETSLPPITISVRGTFKEERKYPEYLGDYIGGEIENAGEPCQFITRLSMCKSISFFMGDKTFDQRYPRVATQGTTSLRITDAENQSTEWNDVHLWGEMVSYKNYKRISNGSPITAVTEVPIEGNALYFPTAEGIYNLPISSISRLSRPRRYEDMTAILSNGQAIYEYKGPIVRDLRTVLPASFFYGHLNGKRAKGPPLGLFFTASASTPVSREIVNIDVSLKKAKWDSFFWRGLLLSFDLDEHDFPVIKSYEVSNRTKFMKFYEDFKSTRYQGLIFKEDVNKAHRLFSEAEEGGDDSLADFYVRTFEKEAQQDILNFLQL